MTEAADEILKMIETVDPADTAKMDEIDARVACYLTTTYEQEFIEMINRCGRNGDGFSFYYKYPNGEQGTSSHNLCVRYTRSRDALKSIRPEGWHWLNTCKYPDNNYHTNMFKTNDDGVVACSGPLPTETLAELHAIIQAIAYDRAQKEG